MKEIQNSKKKKKKNLGNKNKLNLHMIISNKLYKANYTNYTNYIKQKII